ncbi:MAG: cache domain-containing protein [Pseudodesulfovibrio sp.]
MHRVATGSLCAIIIVSFLCIPQFSFSRTAKTHAVRHDAELVVRVTALGLSGILAKVQEREDQILIIQDYIHPARFFNDESGYFFVLDMNGICIAHAIQRSLEGQNLTEIRDVKGVPLFKKMVEKVRNGGGFVEYNWEKPGSDGIFEKLSYVEPIPGTDYFIGSGIYFPEPW